MFGYNYNTGYKDGHPIAELKVNLDMMAVDIKVTTGKKVTGEELYEFLQNHSLYYILYDAIAKMYFDAK